MKENSRRNFLVSSLFAGAGVVGLTACSNNDSNTPAAIQPDVPNIGDGGGLSEAQKDELFYIYQEEKVARDSYITLGEMYPQESTFAHIQKAEQRHIDAARGLCENYGVDISGVDEGSVGNFVVDVLQELYDTVISEGSNSLLDALKMGKLIEVTDIKDLDHAINDLAMPDDVVRVYESLREGSYNHLEAFEHAISTVS